MCRGDDLSTVAAILQRMEQKIDVLAYLLGDVGERVAIADLKLEALDPICDAILKK